MKILDEKAIDAAARMHDYWIRDGSIGALNAVRNTKEIVRAYLRVAEQGSEGEEVQKHD